MKKIFAGEKYRYALLVSVMVAVAAAVFIRAPHQSDVASAQGIPAAPVIGIQASESVDSGCLKAQTNVAWSSNPADYAGSPSYDGSPYGNTDCARIYLSGKGPFSQDFQLGVRMQNPKLPGGWGPWVYTPWAADIARGLTGGNTWSPWGGAIQNVGSDPGHAMYQVTVATRPLPDPGDTITLTSISLQEGDNNNNSNPPYYCAQPIRTPSPDVVTSAGGVSQGGRPYSAPAGWSGVGDLADCTRISIDGANLVGAMEVSNNIPTTFTPSQTQSTGSDGQQISITVKNNGTVAWPTNQATVISNSGSCSVPYLVAGGNNCPALSAPAGTTCTSQVSNSSNVYVLSHISGSFGVNGDPATLKQITTNTCTVGGGGCSNSSPACQASPSACTSAGSCSVGSCNTQTSCGTPTQFGGCGGQWNACNGVWGPGYAYTVGGGGAGVQPGGTGQFVMNSMTAPAVPATYGETWQMKNANGLFGAPFTDNINVSGVLPPGTIAVNSVNSQFPTVGVPATWSFTGYPSGNDPCTGHGGSCSNVSNATYKGLVYTNSPYTLCSVMGTNCHPGSSVTQGSTQYSLRSIETTPIALQSKNWLDKVLSFGKGLIASVARAFNISPAPTQSLNAKSPSATFTMVWNPVASIGLSSPSLGISGSGSTPANGAIIVSNTGSPGSKLTWTTSIAYTNGSGWLSASPSSDAGGLINGISGNASENITFTANPTGLANGTYTATVTFNPYSVIDNKSRPPQALTVTFGVGVGGAVCGNGVLESGEQCDSGASNGVCPASSCSKTCTIQVCPPLPVCSQFDASPATIVIPGASNLRYHCTNVTACALSGGAFGAASSTPILGTTASGTAPVSPGVNTLYTLNCQGLVANASYTTSLNVQVKVSVPGLCESNPNGTGCPKP